MLNSEIDFENLTKEEKQQLEVFDLLKEHILKVSYQMNSDNVEYDQDYGVVNKKIDICKTSIDGKCRMKTCICDEQEEEWYYDICDKCEEYIEMENTVRIPLVGGGWLGCFCSIECIREIYKDDDDIPIREILLNTLEYKINEIPENEEEEFSF